MEETRMSRGLLDEVTLESINQQLPSIKNLEKIVLQIQPDFISTKFKPDSTIPTATVCLQDAVNTLAEARYALHEVIAHKIWYLEKSGPKNVPASVFFGRFYADDIALRLYSAGEHLAEAIVDFLEINEQELNPYRNKKVSRQVIVGNYLRNEKPSHPVTQAVLSLADSSEWQKTIKYRNDWVHSQPPLVKGLGIVYKRGQRWKLSDTENSYKLELGDGDELEYSVDDLLKFIQPALFKFIDTVNVATQFYIDLLKNHGFSFSEDEHGLQVKL
jgi:hypothetical protein